MWLGACFSRPRRGSAAEFTGVSVCCLSAAVYARMLHPEVFPGAVATSHPLSSSPVGNSRYRSFVGSVYELYSAGGSLECRNVLTVGHQEIRRRIGADGVDNGPVRSCTAPPHPIPRTLLAPPAPPAPDTRCCGISRPKRSASRLRPTESPLVPWAGRQLLP